MKTTIDLPDAMIHRAKRVATQRRTTLKQLVIDGLDLILRPGAAANTEAAIARLRKGLRLGGKRLTREQAHERR